MPQNMAKQTRMRYELAQILRIHANPGDGTAVGTKVVLAQIFLVLTDEDRNCVSSMIE
jgi:hypothetical protein